LAVTRCHRWGFPCSVFLLCLRAVATTPVGSLGASIVLFPSDGGLPRYSGGSAPTSLVSRPAQRSLRLRPTDSPSRLIATLPPKALTDSLPPLPLWLLPAGTIVAGRDLHPLKKHSFHGARRVEKWRGGLGEPCVLPALSVAGARTSPHAPFPLPAHRTGQADCPHPALGQGLRLSPTRRSVCAAPVLPDARPGTGRRRGSVPSPDPVPCAWHTTTDAADDTRADRWLDRRG